MNLDSWRKRRRIEEEEEEEEEEEHKWRMEEQEEAGGKEEWRSHWVYGLGLGLWFGCRRLSPSVYVYIYTHENPPEHNQQILRHLEDLCVHLKEPGALQCAVALWRRVGS